MKPVTLLFGHNGTGKSSILAAIDVIFRPKYSSEGEGSPNVKTAFYIGIIQDFQHNYYCNKACVVPFEITIKTTKAELQKIWPDGFRERLNIIPSNTPESRVRITLIGRFQPVERLPGTAEIVLEQARVIGTVLYQFNPSVDDRWLPGLKASYTLPDREKIGERLLNNLTNIYSNIGVARSLRNEKVADAQTHGELKTHISSFQSRLHQIKHSELQSSQNKFRTIREQFNKIAGWGEIDFAEVERETRELEVMTWDENGLWLPVVQRGAGAEQLLVIISEVVLRGSFIIGIEEMESNLDEDTQKKLYDLLELLVGTPDSGVGQIIATAHSYFYGHELLSTEKWIVKKDGRSSTIEPWSNAAAQSLFQPSSYRTERQIRQDAKTMAKKQAKRNQSKS